MENDKFTATASSMKNDDEKASASNIYENIEKSYKKMGWDMEDLDNEEYGIRTMWFLLKVLKESPPPKDRAAECCIYRVPNSLRVSNPEAYTPQLISIGPFHHRSDDILQAKETLKERYQGGFLKRNEIDGNKIIDFLRRIQKEEESVRLCYSERFEDMDKDSFVEMIVLDAVFIIEFLKDSCAAGFPKNIDTRMRFCIEEDLMLLENQLPFSILDFIYSEFYHRSQDENETPLLALATRHFGKYPLAQGPESICTADEVKHFTDLLMKSMLKGKLERENRRDPIKLKYNAAMLRKAGVKFQKTEDKCVFNVSFEKGVLKIPILKVDDSLERVVRNVMAWEQFSKPDEAYISNYFKFMDHLIDRAEDVALLAEEGIIMNWLGDDAAVSKLMNNLSQRSETASYYSDICRELNDYCEKNPWNRRKATLKLVYFSNLWRDSFNGAVLYPLYIRLASALYQYVKSGAVCRTYEKMVFSDKDSDLKQKEENWNQLIKEKGLELINVLEGISCEIHVQEPYFSLLKVQDMFFSDLELCV